jgi:aminoglycoside phosphotransferase
VVHNDNDVNPAFVRAVQTYASYTNHSAANVQSSSGLSGATVGRVRLESQSQAAANFILKVLPFEDAADEFERYRNFVASRLAPGVFAPTVMSISAGLRKQSGLISTLAGDGYQSVFRLLRENPSEAARVVSHLRDKLAPWYDNPATNMITLRELRREKASDDVTSRPEPLGDRLDVIEELEIEMPRVITHGDMHGENILVDRRGQPLLIDFGDVGFGHAPVDPVTLELSLIYHVEGPARDNAIGSSIDWQSWPDISQCYGSSPLSAFASECRSWADEVGSPRATLAFGYAHSLRQLKYPDVAAQIAIAIAQACAGAI